MKGKLLGAAVLLLASAAHADPILIGGLTPLDALSITPVGAAVSVTSSGFSNLASFQGDIGSATFGALGPVTSQPQVAGVFAFVPPTSQTFEYNSLDGDMLTATISWGALDNSGELQLVGTLSVVSSSGDTDFEAFFPPGGMADIFGNFPAACDAAADGPGCFLTDMTVSAAFEGADATPSQFSVPVPEPETNLAFIGMALIAIWWGRRGRHRTERAV